MIDEIIKSYKDFLMVKYQDHYKSFCTRINSVKNSEGARAEAIIFSLLRSQFEKVLLNEDVSKGGADFIAETEHQKFIVEVTCLETETVSEQSGIPVSFPTGPSAGSFSLITHKLRGKASDKASQLANYKMPRVLVITSEHNSADFILGPLGAEMFLTSDTQISVPISIENPNGDGCDLVTDLKESGFFRFTNGTIEACRKSISAILLVGIFYDKSLVTGILHPDPQYVFPINLMPSVPFLKMKEWPPLENQIQTEWIIHSPESKSFHHSKVTFKDEELKNI